VPALPDVIVIGAMKCATSAVHAYLDAHPDVAMSRPKELNFFNGPETAPHDPGTWWRHGQWHRGCTWYADQFDPDVAVRGEASPAYTAPRSTEVPARMARVVPDVRLVYLVRDPLERALSQWAHHRRDGTEPRPVAQALLDPASEYVARSRYHERLEPFLPWFDRRQVLVVVTERLASRYRAEVARLFGHVGVDPARGEPGPGRPVHVGGGPVPTTTRLREAFREQVGDDVARLRGLLGDDLPEWDR